MTTIAQPKARRLLPTRDAAAVRTLSQSTRRVDQGTINARWSLAKLPVAQKTGRVLAFRLHPMRGRPTTSPRERHGRVRVW